MKHTTALPRLIRKADVPHIYGFSERQIKRWITEGKIARVKSSGETGPVWLRTEDLERLIEECTIPVGRRTKQVLIVGVRTAADDRGAAKKFATVERAVRFVGVERFHDDQVGMSAPTWVVRGRDLWVVRGRDLHS